MDYTGRMMSALDRRLFAQHVEEDEHVTRVVHKHWLVGLRELIWPCGLFVFCILLLTLQPNRLGVYVLLGTMLCLLLWAARNFFDYYLDAWVVTDQGIIDLAWLGWFHRQSTRILFSDVQGVSYEVSGVMATLLRYGTVTVEKISTGQTVSLPFVKHPKQVELLILRNMEGYLHSKNMKNASHVQEVLSRFVAEQVQLKSVEGSSQKK